MTERICVATRDQMPKEKHWVILIYGSIYIPGDERSRTNPGHGYPGGNQAVVEYCAYLDRKDWEAEVIRLTHVGNPEFTAMEMTPCKIETSISVRVT